MLYFTNLSTPNNKQQLRKNQLKRYRIQTAKVCSFTRSRLWKMWMDKYDILGRGAFSLMVPILSWVDRDEHCTGPCRLLDVNTQAGHFAYSYSQRYYTGNSTVFRTWLATGMYHPEVLGTMSCLPGLYVSRWLGLYRGTLIGRNMCQLCRCRSLGRPKTKGIHKFEIQFKATVRNNPNTL